MSKTEEELAAEKRKNARQRRRDRENGISVDDSSDDSPVAETKPKGVYSEHTKKTYPDWIEKEKAEDAYFRQFLGKKPEPGRYFVHTSLNITSEEETVEESMLRFDMKNKLKLGEEIKEDLPKEDKANGFIYVNYKNHPFQKRLENVQYDECLPGNIPKMIETAFAEHFGIVLSPAILHHCMSFSVSQFVQNCASDMKEFVVEHEGKKNINVVIDTDMANIILSNSDKTITNNTEKQHEDTLQVFNFITDRLQFKVHEHIKAKELIENLQMEYKNCSLIDKLTNNVQMLSAVKEWFCYSVSVICGFPFVVLRGEAKEWETLERKIKGLKCFFMKCIAKSYPHDLEEFVKKHLKDYYRNKFETDCKDWPDFASLMGTNVEKLMNDEIIDLPKGRFILMSSAIQGLQNLYYEEFRKCRKPVVTQEILEETDEEKRVILMEEAGSLRVDNVETVDKNDWLLMEQIREYERKFQTYANLTVMYNYLAGFEPIVENIHQARLLKDKTEFWNEAFSLAKRMGCGGPPYYYNGWLYKLVMNTVGKDKIEKHESIQNYRYGEPPNTVNFKKGSSSVNVNMNSSIDIKLNQKTMKLNAGVLGYRRINLSKEPDKKMWALEPVLGFNYTFDKN